MTVDNLAAPARRQDRLALGLMKELVLIREADERGNCRAGGRTGLPGQGPAAHPGGAGGVNADTSQRRSPGA
jgi:hypothetical protein